MRQSNLRPSGTEPAPAELAADWADRAAHQRIMSVVAPVGGLVEHVRRLPNPPGFPDYQVFGADLGDLRAVANGAAGNAPSTRGQLSGTGTGDDAGLATRLAVVEAIERYASSVYDEAQFVRASAADLGQAGLDLDTLPRCSERELADPRCPVTSPDRQAVIRWVQGVSLIDHRPVWVPAVLVYLNMATEGPAERFTLQISTGAAAHVDLRSALVNAICEVIERDAITLTWLRRLPLPRLVGPYPTPVGEALARLGSGDVTTHLFDATTDLGVPTVYAVDVTRAAAGFATAVACATSLDPGEAGRKVLREAASGRIALSATRHRPGPEVADFCQVSEGAVYMGQPERRNAFAFLLDTPRRRSFTDLPSVATGDPAGDLAVLVGRLRAANLEAVAVELTTDEARRAGIRVVKVIVPSLMPLSFVHRARFLAHPRLSEGPARMGYPVRDADGLNPWPQPFA